MDLQTPNIALCYMYKSSASPEGLLGSSHLHVFYYKRLQDVPPTTALAEGAGASRVQACRPCLQVSAVDSAIVPLRRTMPAGRLWGSTSSAVNLIIIIGCPPYAVVYHRRSCFSGRCRTYLEWSAAARHLCTLAACFSQSSEDAPLQTLLSVTPSSVFLSCLWSDLS